jgi:hypothetical protein
MFLFNLIQFHVFNAFNDRRGTVRTKHMLS